MKYLVTDQDATVKWIVEASDAKEAAMECSLEDYFTFVYELGNKTVFESILVERTYDES